jgi:hypothetical protein
MGQNTEEPTYLLPFIIRLSYFTQLFPAPEIPNSYKRLAVRRATPATLTGVSGRPTMASADEMRPCTPGIESRSPSSSAQKPMIPAINKIPNRLDKVIFYLLPQKFSVIHPCRGEVSHPPFWRQLGS